MRSNALLNLAILALCVVPLAVVLTQNGARADDPRPLRVAVVNMQAAFETSKIKRDALRRFEEAAEADFKEPQTRIDGDLKAIQERILEKEAELASEDELKKLYQDRRGLEEKRKTISELRKNYEAEMQVKFTAEVLAATLLFIEDVAKAEGYDLVLKNFDIQATKAGTAKGGSLETAQVFQQLLAQASLLYVNGPPADGEKDKKYVVDDITDRVKQKMANASLDGELRKRVNAKLGQQDKN